MSQPIDRVEIISGTHRRRRYTAEEKVRLVEQTMQPGMTVSAVARLQGVSPSLLFQWRRRMSEGGHEAVRADEEVVPISRVRELENKVRELERFLGRKWSMAKAQFAVLFGERFTRASLTVSFNRPAIHGNSDSSVGDPGERAS